MAKLDDSERVLWQQAEQLRRLRVQYRQVQQWLAVLARRQAGVVVIEPHEIMELPHGAVVIAAERPDGGTVLRVETGERREPGSGG